MRIFALTAEWCGKCSRAKKILEDYEEQMVWLDIEKDPEGIRKNEIWQPTHLPFFIIAWEDEMDAFNLTQSAFVVRDTLEKYKK